MSSKKDLESLCKAALPTVRKASEFIYDQIGKVGNDAIEAKEKNSLVSYVDKTAEEKIVEGLNKIIPEASFLTEEGTVEQGDGDLRWIIDPLDGTTNFLHNVPHFSVSVALEMYGDLVIGIVEEINKKETHYAWKGGGAFMNGGQIQVTKTNKIEDALLVTGFPYSVEDTAPILEILDYWIKNTRGIRRFGSAALDLAYVARGVFDFYYETTLNAWDVAGGTVLVREANGVISDYYGNDDFFQSGRILASNGILHQEILSVIQKAIDR